MGKLQTFRIEYDKPGACFSPGETVTGKVILVLTGPKNVREIRFKAKGEAEVHWTEHRTVRDSNGKTRSVTDHYTNSENYFSVSHVLAGLQRDQSTLTIEAGAYSYPFSFRIPNNVPCSFEHHIGHIRYTAKAVIDRPWRFDHKTISAFNVIADYDLNNHPEVNRGIQDEINRKFHYFCCFGDAGSFTALVRTRVSGFVPGETIQLEINYVKDSSSVDLESMKLTLIKQLKFHATSRTKLNSEEIEVKIFNGPFPESAIKTLCIRVPPMPPSNLEHCRIIDISYILRFRIETSGMHRKIKEIYPITIGTIPLRYQAPILPQPLSVPSAPLLDQISSGNDPLPSYQQVVSTQPIGFVDSNSSHYEIPPPTYEECFGGGKFIADPNEEGMVASGMPFAPRYPVYNIPMPGPMPSAPSLS